MAFGSVGALVIGQSPRSDLTELLSLVECYYNIVCRGALDGVDACELPPARRYPLATRLRNGASVTVEESFLTPLLQQELDELEEEGVVASVLLCAGQFAGLAPRRPLVRPFQLGAGLLASMGLRNLGVIVPTSAQTDAARGKWKGTGFAPAVWPMDRRSPSEPLTHWLQEQIRREGDVSAIVIDYVGYPFEVADTMRRAVQMPVLDLGHLAAEALASLLCIPARESA